MANLGMRRSAQTFFIISGFLGIALGAVFGSLLGAKNHLALSVDNGVWLEGMQRVLLRSAHAHWNSMCITWILFGLTIRNAFCNTQTKLILSVTILAFGGPLLFLMGLLWQSYTSPLLLLPSALTAAGGMLYLLSLIIWGSCVWIHRNN